MHRRGSRSKPSCDATISSAIIRETNLMAVQDKLRSPLGKAVSPDRIRQRSRRPTIAQDGRRTLQSRMYVRPEQEGTVTIGVDWPDPQSAFHLVQSAQRTSSSSATRRKLAMIGESIGIPHGHVSNPSGRCRTRSARSKAHVPTLWIPDHAALPPPRRRCRRRSRHSRRRSSRCSRVADQAAHHHGSRNVARTDAGDAAEPRLADCATRTALRTRSARRPKSASRPCEMESPQVASLKQEEVALQNQLARSARRTTLRRSHRCPMRTSRGRCSTG